MREASGSLGYLTDRLPSSTTNRKVPPAFNKSSTNSTTNLHKNISRQPSCGCVNRNNTSHNSVDRKQINTSSSFSQDDPPREKNTDEEMAHYLLNEILLVISNLNRFNRERITFLQYMEILRELNMISPSYEPINDDEVYDFWALLCQGSKEHSVCLVNYAILLLAVMNIKGQPSAIKRFFEGVPYAQNNKSSLFAKRKQALGVVVERPYKRNKQGYYQLTQTEVGSIYKTFKAFRITRMHLGQIERKIQIVHNRSSQKFTFQPQISSRSKKLPRGDSSKRCQHHQSLDKQNDQECTFQPNIHKSSEKKDKDAGMRKSNQLYKRSKQRRVREFDKEQLEYRRNSQQCTFKPLRTKDKRKSMGQVQPSKNQHKQVGRLKNARMQKEVMKAVSKSGLPMSDKNYQKIRQSVENELKGVDKTQRNQEVKPTQTPKLLQSNTSSLVPTAPTSPLRSPPVLQKKPLMSIEVFINEDQIDNIQIMEGDQPSDLAYRFSLKHNLDAKMTMQLVKQIQNALKFSLCQIAEESLQCSEDC